MKLTLEQHGGFAAAITNRMRQVVESDSLSAAAKEELARLVAAAEGSQATPAVGRAADATTYMLTIEDDAGTRTISQSDVTMSEAFGALLSFLKRSETIAR